MPDAVAGINLTADCSSESWAGSASTATSGGRNPRSQLRFDSIPTNVKNNTCRRNGKRNCVFADEPHLMLNTIARSWF